MLSREDLKVGELYQYAPSLGLTCNRWIVQVLHADDSSKLNLTYSGITMLHNIYNQTYATAIDNNNESFPVSYMELHFGEKVNLYEEVI